MKKIEEQLQLMGLSSTETKVYLGLLKSGKTSILELSKQIKVNRTTTHMAIESLISKGLVNQI
jgi:sugar-specific transcriptional regulator TrmB